MFAYTKIVILMGSIVLNMKAQRKCQLSIFITEPYNIFHFYNPSSKSTSNAMFQYNVVPYIESTLWTVESYNRQRMAGLCDLLFIRLHFKFGEIDFNEI